MNRTALQGLTFLLALAATTAVMEVNDVLGPKGIALHLDLLWVLFPGFYFAPLPGFILTALLALFLGAARPLSISLSFFVFLGLWLTAVLGRRRLQRENLGQLIPFAISIQVGEIFLLGLFLGKPEVSTWTGYLLRLLSEAGLAALVLLFLTWPWTRFHLRLLASFGWNLENETVRT